MIETGLISQTTDSPRDGFRRVYESCPPAPVMHYRTLRATGNPPDIQKPDRCRARTSTIMEESESRVRIVHTQGAIDAWSRLRTLIL